MKRLITILSLFLAIISANAQTQSEQSSFEQLKNLAKSRMQTGDYSTAKSIYKNIYDSYGRYKSFIDEVSSDYESCIYAIEKAAAAKTASERLILSSPLTMFQQEGGTKEVTVSAGSKGNSAWNVVSSPAWCSVAKDGNKLLISVPSNPDPKMRVDDITVEFVSSTKKTVSRQVSVMQNARPLVSRSVRIITEPEGANITVGSNTYISPVVLSLTEGDVPLHIIRTNYESLDTFITINPDGDDKQTAEYRFSLTPRFAAISFSMKARTGYIDDKNPQMFIDNHIIDLNGFFGRKSPRSVTENVLNRYEIYVDSDYNYIIPIENGSHIVRITADDFETYEKEILVENGQVVPVNAIIEPKQGTIRFLDGGYADGAIIKDGSTPIGVVHGETVISFTADDHKISFDKLNHTTREAAYSIHVFPGSTQDFMVSMDPSAYMSLQTAPTNAQVKIDGVDLKVRTPLDSLPVICGEHIITLEHEGYYPTSFEAVLDRAGTHQAFSIEMPKSHKLTINSDAHKYTNSKSSYNVYLMGGDQIFEYDHFTDASFLVPYGKYKIELRRYSLGPDIGYRDSLELKGDMAKKDLAYRGNINFREGGRDCFKLMSYSEKGCPSLLNVNYYPSSSAFMVDENPILSSSSYRILADAGLAKFKVFSGFSTSFIRSRIYQNTVSGTQMSNYLFGLTCLLLNGEFRMGGSLSQYADINFLTSYALDIPINKILDFLSLDPINSVNASDVFIGAELASRIPVFNANVRAGYRISKGAMYIKDGDELQRGAFNDSGFVISLGFTLGGYDSKGSNTIRLFNLL